LQTRWIKILTGALSPKGSPVRLNRLGQKIKSKNMQQDEKIFADGFIFKRNENAPDFVVGRLSMKADEAIAFIRQHDKKGWVNLNIKTARSGNHYVELDTYEPKGQAEQASAPASKSKPKKAVEKEDNEELPF
jgi:hypothetical protein